MGRIEIDLYTTLDLVAQAPGDPEDGFAFGGWQAPFVGDDGGEEIMAGMATMDALLLGRKTYNAFAEFWPLMADDFAGGVAGKFNHMPKYVASRSTLDLAWAGSTQIGPDVASAVQELRERHEEVHVIGSVDFVQTLLAERLFDRLNLFVHPIVLGSGEKVFGSGAIPANLTLVKPAVSTSMGAVLLHYDLADGVPATGDMTKPDFGLESNG
jgi:dihydrofolate reductase